MLPILKKTVPLVSGAFRRLRPSWWLAATVLWSLVLLAAWWAGPHLVSQGTHPLAGLWPRTVFTLFWLWLLCVVALGRFWSRVQRQRKPASQQNVVERQQRFLNAWLAAQSRQSASRDNKPWFLMLGLPRSGKSSLLQRACPPNKLNVRLDRELAALHKDQKVDCWLGDEAVVVDPDGDLVFQPAVTGEEGANPDARRWQQLLSWLTARCRRQPLNGLILTLDVAWLSTAGVTRRRHCAQLLRERLRDIASAMHTRLPVYVVLTHVDNLEGFSAFSQQLDREARQSLLGLRFTPENQQAGGCPDALSAFMDLWLNDLTAFLRDTLQAHTGHDSAVSAFRFIRQLAGLTPFIQTMLEDIMPEDGAASFPLQGVWLSSVYQMGVPSDAFADAVSRRYSLPAPLHSAARGDSTTFFVRDLFTRIIFPGASLAGQNRQYQRARRRRMVLLSGVTLLVTVLSALSLHHFYQVNASAGHRVLTRVQTFSATRAPTTAQTSIVSLLPRLNLIREATLSYGDYRSKQSAFADMGLYQGNQTGPFVENAWLKQLQSYFLPAVMAELVQDLQQAPPASEAKMSVLRVMRMIDDASGRSIPLVEQYMAQRWQKAFPEQGAVQEQLMQHLDYALRHTDWHRAREQKDPTAMAVWTPFAQPVADAQRELSRLPLYQRVYQGLLLRAASTLPPDLQVQDETGQSFDSVFALRDAQSGTVPRLFTWSGYRDFFINQNKTLFDLTGLDAWVLGQREQVHLSDADRREIQRQVNDRYISDYTGHWQKLLSSLDIQPFDTPEQALSMLNTITGDEQPFRHVVSLLADNTAVRPLDGKGETPQRDTNRRIARPFTQLDETLKGHGDSASRIQDLNQKLTALAQWLEQINGAGDPGAAAFKALQLRQSNPYNDPAYTLQQYARGLPAPLDRWVSQIATQAADVTTSLAMSSLNQSWDEQVLTPFNTALADRYPFNPASDQDASLSEVTRFFAPGGTLDSFYQAQLKPLLDSGILKQAADNGNLQALMRQMAQAQLIRDALFNARGQPEVSFVVEPVELTANKRRSVLNLDGQLVEYSHGMRQKVPLLWPNAALRDGAESRATLIPDDAARSPRSLGFTGPWAMFRLLEAGSRTQARLGSFDVSFSVDDGTMTWRVYSDADHSPFATGLFSRFQLPETLY
ncbi:type VI secretion system membrane subunit TssM [Enterobacter cloacae complex sp. ESBL7]|uniref:type VI secretion system membrane subunit TssM n=1 Tax=Enterobacter cloacae complex sp. ESBL7 TaxID=3163325 RepID=UPI0035679B9D